jgi:two-component SAPR family response regulator
MSNCILVVDAYTSKIPIVFITADETFIDSKFGLTLNGKLDIILIKPVENELLLKEIRNLVNNERMMNSIDRAISSAASLKVANCNCDKIKK